MVFKNKRDEDSVLYSNIGFIPEYEVPIDALFAGSKFTVIDNGKEIAKGEIKEKMEFELVDRPEPEY
jgi:hypothetical protein